MLGTGGRAFLPVRQYIEYPGFYGFAIAGENGVPTPNIQQMLNVWGDWNRVIIAVSQQETTPAEALQVTADKIRANIAWFFAILTIDNPPKTPL